MEFTLPTEELKSILGTVQGTFGSDSFPALNGIYFSVDANGEGICRSANGSEKTKVKFTPKAFKEGKALLDGNVLTKIAKTFAKGDVEIEVDSSNHSAKVKHPTGEVQITGIDPSHFPPDEGFQEDTSFVIPAEDLSKALKSVEFARNKKASPTDKLYGIGMIVENGKTLLAATDRRRIAKYEFDTPSADDINLVLSPNVASGLSSIQGNIAVRLAETGIAFETNDVMYVGPIMTQQYPPVKRFFPDSTPNEANIPRDILLDVLERVAIIGKAGKDNPDAEFEFDTQMGLTIKFNSGKGKLSELIPCSYSGTDMTVIFNVDVLIDGIKKMKSDNIEMFLTAADKPAIIYPEGDHDFGFFVAAVV